eukprot:gene38814-47203_t
MSERDNFLFTSLCSKIPNGARLVQSALTNHQWLSLHYDCSQSSQTWSFQSALPCTQQSMLVVRRWKVWWLAPAWVTMDGLVPPETYLLVGQLSNAHYLVLLPTIDQEVSFSLEGSQLVDAAAPDAVLCVVGHCRDCLLPARDCAALLVSTGPDLYSLLGEAFALVRCRLRGESFQVPAALRSSSTADSHNSTNGTNSSSSATAWRFRGNTKGPGGAFADGLGWCTWDSFYTDLAANRVLQGLQAFRAQGVRPRTVVLDDGWQDSDCSALVNGFQWTGRLASLDANYKFSEGFERPLALASERRKYVAQSPAGLHSVSLRSWSDGTKEEG